MAALSLSQHLSTIMPLGSFPEFDTSKGSMGYDPEASKGPHIYRSSHMVLTRISSKHLPYINPKANLLKDPASPTEGSYGRPKGMLRSKILRTQIYPCIPASRALGQTSAEGPQKPNMEYVEFSMIIISGF